MPAPIFDSSQLVPHETVLDQTFAAPDMSIAQSFHAPADGQDDLIPRMRNPNGRHSHRTPRTRSGLHTSRVVRTPGTAQNEFTPLLKTANRNRLAQSINGMNGIGSRLLGGPNTPALLRNGYVDVQTPGLPEHSAIADGFDENGTTTISSGLRTADATPAPLQQSSSLPSSPSGRHSGSTEKVLFAEGQGKGLTLKEQEAKIEDLDKQNFGLKLKIHYLEESLKKTGTEYQQQTIRENVQLKVDHTNMQQELKRLRKTLSNGDAELKGYRLQLGQYAEQVKRRHADERLAEELEELRRDKDALQKELDQLKESQLNLPGVEEQAQQLQDDVADLKAEVREKERQLDQKDEEIEGLKERLGDLERGDEDVRVLEDRIEDLEAAIRDKEQQVKDSEEDIAELQTKLAVRNSRLEEELQAKDMALKDQQNQFLDLKTKFEGLKQEYDNNLRSKVQQLDDKMAEIRQLQAQLQSADRDHSEQLRRRTKLDEDRVAQIRDLQEQLRSAEGNTDEQLRKKNQLIEEQASQLAAIQERLRTTENDLYAQLRRKSKEIDDQADLLRDAEDLLKSANQSKKDLSEKLQSEKARAEKLGEQVLTLQDQVRQTINHTSNDLVEKDRELDEQRAKVRSLQRRAEAAEAAEVQVESLSSVRQELTPMKQTVRTKEDEIRNLQREMERLKGQRAQSSPLEQTLKLKDDEIRVLCCEIDHLKEAQTMVTEKAAQKEKRLEHELADVKGAAEEEKQALEDDIVLLESDIDQLTQEKEDLESRVAKLEAELVDARQASVNGAVQPGEDRSLHRMLEEAKSEAETLDVQLKEREMQLLEKETRIKSLIRTEQELRDRLAATNIRLRDFTPRKASQHPVPKNDTDSAQLIASLRTSEADLKDQLRTSQLRIEELELELASLEVRVAGSSRSESDLRQRLKEANRKAHTASPARHELQSQLQDAEAELETLQSQLEAKESHIQALQQSERQLQAKLRETKRASRADNETMTVADLDLRAQLRDAKLEAEDLALQVKEREHRIQSCLAKEQELRQQLKRVREERATQTSRANEVNEEADELKKKCEQLDGEVEKLLRDKDSIDAGRKAVEKELDNMLKRYEGVVDEMGRLQDSWEDERRLLTKSAANSTPAKARERKLQKALDARATRHEVEIAGLEQEIQLIDKRHGSEIKGLVKQIQWLRARCGREERFRSDLVFMKKWFLMQVQMFGACNQADLSLLAEIGITPDPSTHGAARPTLRTVSIAIVASIRLKKMQSDWAVAKRGHEALLRTLEGMRKKSMKSGLGR